MTAPELAEVTDLEEVRAGVPQTVEQAAETGDERDLLVALKRRIAKTVTDPLTPPRDLAALSRRLIDINKEIAALDTAEGGDDIGQAAETPDEEFEAEAL